MNDGNGIISLKTVWTVEAEWTQTYIIEFIVMLQEFLDKACHVERLFCESINHHYHKKIPDQWILIWCTLCIRKGFTQYFKIYR